MIRKINTTQTNMNEIDQKYNLDKNELVCKFKPPSNTRHMSPKVTCRRIASTPEDQLLASRRKLVFNLPQNKTEKVCAPFTPSEVFAEIDDD